MSEDEDVSVGKFFFLNVDLATFRKANEPSHKLSLSLGPQPPMHPVSHNQQDGPERMGLGAWDAESGAFALLECHRRA